MQPPQLNNQYDEDPVLRSYLQRVLPREVIEAIEPSLIEMGQLAGGDLYQFQLADRLNEPKLTQWDAWGNRIDEVEVTPLWRHAERIAAEHGVVATAYEQKHGAYSRVHQCALAYLFTPSTDIYSCPLAMTDGAARTLLASSNQKLIDRAVPHFTTRDPREFWTSGQWMTEITGGSDVGTSQTVATPSPRSKVESPTAQPDTWFLYGSKWFTSAINAPVALTLAHPEGNPPGGRGLALFYIELRDENGRLRNITIDRLKDKLGTRKVPTAELTLNGTPARLVMGTTDGVRNITPLLNTTRLWNGISAVALMRRGLALASEFARTRIAFGALLSEKPLHVDTLQGLEAEFAGAFQLAFFIAELTGKSETGEISEDEKLLLRLLTPVMKLTTGKQAVMVLSEVLECFGGAGYVEDTGLPQLLRDAQVLPIWEGTTNVLSLDTLRALGLQERGRPNPPSLHEPFRERGRPRPPSLHEPFQERGRPRPQTPPKTSYVESPMPTVTNANELEVLVENISSGFAMLRSFIARCFSEASDPRLTIAANVARAALEHAEQWLMRTRSNSIDLEAGARRFALTLGRTTELALLIRQAQWMLDQGSEGPSVDSAVLLAKNRVDLIFD